jgi:hypothetical protein
VRLQSSGFDDVAVFGPFVIARRPLEVRTVTSAIRAGLRAYRVARVLSPGTPDFARLAGIYRIARGYARHPESCPAPD